MNNKYYRHSRISERKFRQIINCFVCEKTAAETAECLHLDRKSVDRIFLRVRRRILESGLKDRPRLNIKNARAGTPFFTAKSETQFREYSKKYSCCAVLTTLFDNGYYRADILFAQSNEPFKKINELLGSIKIQGIVSMKLFSIDREPLWVPHKDVQFLGSWMIPYYSGNFFVYFFWRRRKFKGTSWDKFSLHIAETEWRFNTIIKTYKFEQKLTAEINAVIVKNQYNHLLEILRNNPL